MILGSWSLFQGELPTGSLIAYLFCALVSEGMKHKIRPSPLDMCLSLLKGDLTSWSPSGPLVLSPLSSPLILCCCRAKLQLSGFLVKGASSVLPRKLAWEVKDDWKGYIFLNSFIYRT